MMEALLVSLRQSLSDLGTAVVTLGPRVLVAFLLIVLGWLIARALQWGTARLAGGLSMDRYVERTSLADALRLAELPSASRLLASVVFWLVWLVFLAEALDLIQLPGFEHSRADLVDFIGRLVKAVIILVVGVFASNVAWRVSLLAAYNAGWPSARALAATLRVLVLAVAVLTALAQLGIPMVIVLTAFSIAFGALMLGVALAFGLGGRDAARDVIARHAQSVGTHKEGGQPHL